MAATILGKRSRGATVADSTTSSIATRAKRRITLHEPDDENQNPFISGTGQASNVDEAEPPIKKTRSSSRAAPARHGAHASRIEPSPVRAVAHFRVAKSAIGVYQDGKDGDEENVPPKTPRHRDALSKKVPVTPQHRVLLAKNNNTPRTPKTPSTSSVADTSIYHQARKLFSRCSAPGKLIGRGNERSELSTFIRNAIDSKSAGCLYVSGPPGTGKSALLSEVIEEHTKNADIPISVVNCMSVQNTKDLSQKLSDDLGLQEDAGFDYLRSCFVRERAKNSKKYLVVLDEVDRLVDLDLALLYGLFEWSMQNGSRLILIGIANALDLTDRFLPRLKSRNLKPDLLPFMPYSAAQIAEVVTSKLKSLSTENCQNTPFLQPAAIQFCAKKVAAQTGDLRKAFDICRRAIDLIDRETREKDARLALEISPSKTPLMENINLASPPSPRSPVGSRPKTAYTLETAPKATIAHIAKITAQVFSNGATQRLGSLNIQQKAVLCALSALEKRKREAQVERTMFATPSKTNSSAPSVKQLFLAYSGLCKRENLFHPLSAVEFRDVVAGLETLSLLSAVDGRNGSFAVPMTPSRTPGRKPKGAFGGAPVGDERRVSSAVATKELSAALDGPGGDLLREILEGDGLQ